MKIAFLIETFPSTTEVAILNQVVALVENGVDVTIFTFNKSFLTHKRIHKKVFKHPLKIIELPKPEFSKYNTHWKNILDVRYKAIPFILKVLMVSPRICFNAIFAKKYGDTKKAYKIIYAIQPLINKDLSFDVIHCQFGPLGVWGAILRDLGVLSGKLVTSFRGYDINDLPDNSNKDIYSFLKQEGDLYTANTSNTKQNAIKLGFDRDKIKIIHSSISVDDFKFLERDYNKKDVFEIVTVARLTEVKGLEYAIKAMAILKNDFGINKIRYRIVGDGELKLPLQQLIDINGLNDCVVLEGFHSQETLRSVYYSKAHLFILPSIITTTGNREAQGIVLQEAQACGIPVIGTNTGGIPEGILKDKSGFIVSDKDSLSIAKVVVEFMKNPSLINQMGKNGRRFVQQKFDVKSVTDNLIKLYNR